MTHLLLRYPKLAKHDFLNRFSKQDETAISHVDERLIVEIRNGQKFCLD